MNKTACPRKESPVTAGLFLCLVLILASCVSAKTPEQVTLAFWTALAEGNMKKAKRYATQDSRDLVSSSAQKPLENTSYQTRRIIIDGDQATVETLIHRPTDSDENQDTDIFLTVLTREDGDWRVDYRQTRKNLSGNLFDGFLDSLQNLGEKLNKQLERQLPKIEKELESLGNELEKQMDEFGDDLEKSFPPENSNDQTNTI